MELDLTNLKSITPRRVFDSYLLNKPEKIIDRISPSQLGKCHRAHWLKIRHVKPLRVNTVSELANFELGFVWETMIRRALDDQKVPYEFQTEFYDPELNMSGTSDFIIGDKTTESYMWDSKTMRAKWFWYRDAMRKRGSFDPWKEDYGYIIQQGAYLLMAERLGYKVHTSTLAYVNKDDSFIGDELIVSLTAKLRKELMRRIKDLNHYLAHDILPPCTCDGWEVGYCSFGNPNTMEPNSKKKLVSTECCGSEEEIESWRIEYAKKRK